MSSEPPAKRAKPPLPGGCAAVSKAVAGGAPVLAVALGGGSDVVGVLALARALGATRAILVQPGSPARGTEAPPTPSTRAAPSTTTRRCCRTCCASRPTRPTATT